MQAMPDWSYLSYPGIVLAATFTDREGREQMAAILSDSLLAMGDRATMQDMLAEHASRLRADQPARASVRKVLASEAEVAMALTSTAHLSEDALGFELLEDAWFEMRFDRDVHLHSRMFASEEQVAEGLLQIIGGSLLLGERHPDISGHPAYLDAIRNAEAQRQGQEITVDATVSGQLLAEQQHASSLRERLQDHMARLRERRGA